MNIDLHEVIRAAATKPFGFVPYYPGPGIGGHCIPIDPFYLTWKAREFGVHTRFIELAGEVNSSMPDYVVTKIVDGLNSRKKSVSGSHILVLGLAYKKNVDDSRESPAVVIMERLRDLGAQISYSDPHIPVFPVMRTHHFSLSSVALTRESISTFDCVVLATDHDRFDYELIGSSARLLVDCRGRFIQTATHIVRA
jgi:UDP-N-acetyl-D-glucosamine dehydrogenase